MIFVASPLAPGWGSFFGNEVSLASVSVRPSECIFGDEIRAR